MNAISYSQKILNIIESFDSIRLGIYFSLFFHLIILLFATGLPDLFKPKPIILPNIIPIEIVNVTENTSITNKIVKDNNQPVEKKLLKQKKFNASENVEIKKIEIQKKPEIIRKDESSVTLEDEPSVTLEKAMLILPKEEKKIKEKKLAQNIQVEKIEPVKNIESLSSSKIKPKLKPKPKKNVSKSINTDVEINTKIKPKLNNIKTEVVTNPKPRSKPKPDFSIASLYKDLRYEESNNVSDENIKEKKDEKNETNITSEKDNESINSELSISEIDLVLQQLRGCFNPQAGTIIEKDEMVVVSAEIGRNAKVKTNTIQISDTNIDINNPYYKSITESAMRTLYNPACSILKLPKEKYDTWKKLTIKFDYSWITK